MRIPSVVVAALLLVLAGCSGSNSSNDATAGGTAVVADGPRNAATADRRVDDDSDRHDAAAGDGIATSPDGLAFSDPDPSSSPPPSPGSTTTSEDRPPQSAENPFAPYTGMLGTLAIDEVLYGAPGPVPVAEAGTLPLTGVRGRSPARPAVVVKIDNSSKARPQLGLNAADIVFEEQVEAGITRLAAVFHSNTAEVGPVRSARTTDISFINALGGPALVYSGANKVIDSLLLRQATIQNFSAARDGNYWRDAARPAPSNLLADTGDFVHRGSPPPAQFTYGRPGSETWGDRTAAFRLLVTFPSTSVGWTWDGVAWVRTQNGTPHRTADGATVSAANVVTAVVPEVLTGLVDSAGGQVPEYIFAGSGPVSVFSNGERIDGTWTRPSLRSAVILVDGAGNIIELNPGRTWVELVVEGSLSSS